MSLLTPTKLPPLTISIGVVLSGPKMIYSAGGWRELQCYHW
eukprot:SAG11_NODE_3157_length_2644_cov_2.227112_2_plen_41_part_00